MKKKYDNEDGFVLVSFALIFPVFILLIHFSFNWASEFKRNSYLRFTCLQQSHAIQKILLKHLDHPRRFNQKSFHLSRQLENQLRQISPESRLILYPKYEQKTPFKSTLSLVYKVNSGTLCGAQLKKEGAQWNIKVIYKTTEG